nr:hypothetical protein [uncultured Cohaesibacter sp.]
MIKEPTGYTIFCDDIRQEISNKLTLVGCYGSEVVFRNEAPTVLPAFAAMVTIIAPCDMKLISIELIAEFFDGSTLLELSRIKASPADKEAKVAPDGEPARGKSVSIPIQWSPLRFMGNGYLRISCSLNGGEPFRVGKIPFLFPESEGKN